MKRDTGTNLQYLVCGTGYIRYWLSKCIELYAHSRSILSYINYTARKIIFNFGKNVTNNELLQSCDLKIGL